MKLFYLLVIYFIGIGFTLGQTNKIEGPVILEYGGTWEIEDPDLKIEEGQKFHMVFDISQKPSDPNLVNSSINSIARFVNMHVKAGVKMQDISLIAVVHGSAGNDVISDEAHLEKFGTKNPNAALIRALDDIGVQIFLCGQTMNARKIDRATLLPEVKVALSAMTVISTYVSQGYALIKF